MTPEATYNALPEGFKGNQQRRTEFDATDEKLSYDAKGLIDKAKKEYKRKIVTVADAFDLRSRKDDHDPEGLRRAIASEIKNLEQVEIDARLMSLVIGPINALSEAQRTVKGKVRSGEEIARAIPDVTAFLAEVDLQKRENILLDFFELNEAGQLVMKDNCPEAYGLGDNALEARMRQTRIVYREDGQTEIMTGEECFKVTKRDQASRPVEMEASEAARNITPKSILMARGLPTLKWNGERHTGEYARMNTGQLERQTYTWTDDDSLDAWRTRNAFWFATDGRVLSDAHVSGCRSCAIGSRGVLRVNLNLES